MSDTTQKPSRIHWRLRDVMTERGVPSIAALQRRLLEHYPAISEVQLGRVVHDLPTRLNVPLLTALCRALECAPIDLLYWSVEPPATEAKNARKPRSRPEPSADDIARLLGPSYAVIQSGTKETAS